MDDERDKSRMKEATNEMTYVIPIFELWMLRSAYWWICTIGKGGDCWCIMRHGWVGEFGMGRTSSSEFIFEWRTHGEEWCGWPTNTSSQESSSPPVCPLNINFVMEQFSEFLVVDVMTMHAFMNELNKMSISNLNKHHQKTINC